MDNKIKKESSEKIKKSVVAFLKENFVMDIATSRDDKPAVAPVVYVIDEELNFYFVTYRMSFKAQNLIANPKCSVSIWKLLQMSVQADGTTSIVDDVVKKEWVINAFADAATKDPNFWAPIFRIKKGDYCVFKITPTWMRVLDLAHNTVRQEDSPYIEIDL